MMSLPSHYICLLPWVGMEEVLLKCQKEYEYLSNFSFTEGRIAQSEAGFGGRRQHLLLSCPFLHAQGVTSSHPTLSPWAQLDVVFSSSDRQPPDFF